jgi:hypothetical protein
VPTTGSFIKVVKVSSFGLKQVNALTSDSTHLWAVDSDTNAVAELNAGTGSLVKVLKGKAYRFDGPWQSRRDGDHVWVANERTRFAHRTEREDRCLRALHQGQDRYGLSVVTAIASNGTDVWVTNLGPPVGDVGGHLGGNSVSEISVSTGASVQVLSGARYGFNNPNAITYVGGRLWVANVGRTR